ncbi:Hypothetical_protein [Hexamita inflata]|uniref:Hypothetical_protein n=1 Tax=Hexamita inflata TaxID=28002 RepID=A0AA86QPV0_9EUKA|nr:Hypothetical protein HINF_LOCUS44634 [Hexamita inflata]
MEWFFFGNQNKLSPVGRISHFCRYSRNAAKLSRISQALQNQVQMEPKLKSAMARPRVQQYRTLHRQSNCQVGSPTVKSGGKYQQRFCRNLVRSASTFPSGSGVNAFTRTFQLDEFSTGEGKSVSALEYFRVQIAYLGRLTDVDPICALRNSKFAKHKLWRRWLCQFGLSRPLYVISRLSSASQHSAVVTTAFHALSAVKFQAHWFHALFFQYSWWRKWKITGLDHLGARLVGILASTYTQDANSSPCNTIIA